MRRRRPRAPTAESKRLAVVEETTDDIYSIQFVLQSLGFRTQSFSPRSSMADLMGFGPDLIIVDMMISGGGGYRAIRQIRRAGNLDRVPILAIGAAAMEGSPEEILAAGGQEVVIKPYNMTELREKLDRLVPKAK
ncbi:MAG: response regulator [Candidatus Aminicenantes bacterium]|nr:response regulator [Candidatus Aminicenantes bacterium]